MTYFRHLELYDYVAVIWFILTFFLLFLVSILLIRRSLIGSFFIFLLSLAFLVTIPFVIKSKLNAFLRPIDTRIVSMQKLIYSPTLIIQTTIANTSQRQFQTCLIQADVHPKNTSESLLSFFYSLKPISNQSILVQKPLDKGKTLEYEIVFDHFTYQGDVVVYVTTECY